MQGKSVPTSADVVLSAKTPAKVTARPKFVCTAGTVLLEEDSRAAWVPTILYVLPVTLGNTASVETNAIAQA